MLLQLLPLVNLCCRRYNAETTKFLQLQCVFKGGLTNKEIRHIISPCGCCFRISFRVQPVTSTRHEWCELSAKEISEAAFPPWTLE